MGSTYNSDEDIATSRAASEVEERLDLGMLASWLLTLERQVRSLCLLCCAVSRRVSRVVARCVLFVIRDWSLGVDCLSL